MNIKLKNNKSADNTINKIFDSEIVYTDCTIKARTSVVNPVVILKSDTYLNYNYAEIPEFSRSYFITNVTLFPNKIYELTLRCDVLESFKNDILESTAWIKQRKDFNQYYDDGYFLSEVKKEIDIYESNTYLDLNYENIIMVTSGAK